ncbi:MAG: hypothetical protein HRU13_13255, partial [Phycisphaerales bacterium]|nr:hypothetical protein [Phycisphaerales bacterium]
MIVNNEKEAIQLLQSLRMASDHTRRDLMARSIQDQAYFAGCQWIHSNGQYGSAKIGRLLTSLNPDKRKLRVTLNRVTRNVLRAASSTRPSKILAEVTPLGDRSGPDDYHLADLFETMLEGAIDSTGFLNCARQANLRRCVSGTYGVGFALDATQSRRNVGGVERDVPDIRLRAMMFPAYYLSLDPSVDSHNLCDHDEVVYSDIWTKAKAERVLGQKLDEKDLLPIGQLAAHELAMNELVGYTLFEKYRKDSQKLGVRVHQMHVKTEDGRFGQMFVILETKGSRRIVNADNPETPFGGHAMPLGLIRAHARADCHWGLSDVSMVKADQDILNLHATQYHRIMQKAGHPKWIVDRRALGRSVSEEEVARNLNNEVAGPIFVDPGRRDEKAVMPTMHNLPGPQPFLLEGQDRSEQAILDGTFRAPGHVGQTKSHVADASFQRAIEEADVPVGIRVEEDIETY